MDWKIDGVVEALRHSKDKGRGCSLLIGAGCSVTAGIPAGAGFVDLIRKDRPDAYRRAAEPKAYPQCMAALSPGTRRDLIAEKIAGARINWAHAAIAQLMAHGYVDRVLTTNFDPLVLRACAAIGVFPAVYDFAASTHFNRAFVPDRAVFHLHGQSTGFVLMNTPEECDAHSRRLGSVFEDAGSGRTWIVVGYSGESDPVFDHLADVKCFDYSLFWVGYKDDAPGQHVRERLLTPGREAHLVSGHDADGFFVKLAQDLDCFPPEFVRRPFSHLKATLSHFTEFRLGSGTSEIDVLEEPRKKIEAAIAQHENGTDATEAARSPSADALDLAVTELLMAGKYEEVERVAGYLGDGMSDTVCNALVWSHIMRGNALSDQATMKAGEEADRLFAAAGEKYAAALAIKPDLHEALSNWGNALSAQARTKAGEEAGRLFAAACEKYAAALAIKPDDHEALYNWGNALSDQAMTKAGEEADRLFAAAYEKYAAALAIKPDDQANRPFAAAFKKFAAALASKLDKHEALYNWGGALAAQAQTKAGEEAERLFAAACEKYAAALAIKLNDHEALYNWGNTLLHQAQTKAGEEAERLFDQATEKLLQAEAVKHGAGSYDLACIAALRGHPDDCRRWLDTARQHGKLPNRAYLESDTDLDSVRDAPWFQEMLASR